MNADTATPTACGRCGHISVKGYAHRSEWTVGVPCSDACLTCGALVEDMTQHSAWHRVVGLRGGCACGPAA